MKRLLVTVCALALVFVCKESVAQQKQMIKKQVKMNKVVRMDNMSYPYTASYSSNFTIGNPADAKMVMELWKDLDDNSFTHDYIADTAVMYFADGTMAKGGDSILAGVQKYRSSMSNVTSTVDAVVPLKSVDRNENWVAIWGTDSSTSPDGKVEKRDINEIWRFNKDGKVDFMKQFTAKSQMMEE